MADPFGTRGMIRLTDTERPVLGKRRQPVPKAPDPADLAELGAARRRFGAVEQRLQPGVYPEDAVPQMRFPPAQMDFDRIYPNQPQQMEFPAIDPTPLLPLDSMQRRMFDFQQGELVPGTEPWFQAQLYGRALSPTEEVEAGLRKPASMGEIIDRAREAEGAYGEIFAAPITGKGMPWSNDDGYDYPGSRYVNTFAEEALRPTSLAAMAAPVVRIGTMPRTVLANAAMQGGANVLQDVLLGRTGPEELALSAGLGAGLGGVLPETGTIARKAKDLAQSPEGQRALDALQSESGALRMARGPEDLGGAAGEVPLTAAQESLARQIAPQEFFSGRLPSKERLIRSLESAYTLNAEESALYRDIAGIQPYDEAVRLGAAKALPDQPIRSAQAFETPLPEALGEADAAPRAETGIPASEAASRLPGQPPALGGGPPERPPTIREIEARSAPLTPEQRARFPRDTEQAFYRPSDFAESTEFATQAAEGGAGGTLQAVQNVVADVPVLRSLASFTEPMAAARGAKKAGNIIPEAMVRRELFIDTQKAQARAGFYAWIDRNRARFGLNSKGIARDVGVRMDAEIPPKVRGRLDDIMEHPDDYVLSPEQTGAIDEIRHTLNAITQEQLAAGVDVREVEGAYFPRIVKGSPKGKPRGTGGGTRLVGRPGHAKPREFADIREGVAAGYEYANPMEALQARIDTGIDSIGAKRTLETIKPLGQKPSERVPQALRDEYLDAKTAYKAERIPANEKRLEEAKRALRVAARTAAEPKIGEARGFGRIFPAPVMEEIGKYTDVKGPNAIEEFFRVQRATTTTADLSAAFVQGGNLFYRNNIAWWKALGYSIASTAREPFGYVARNIDVVREGIDAGAIVPPTEFQLARGGGLAHELLTGDVPSRLAQPVTRAITIPVRAAQRAFEWMIFVGQTEWWKGARAMATTGAERRELASVIRKGTGSMRRPGLTNAQRKAEVGTFFAGRFLMATNGLAADALRGGVRGAEARKTLGSLIAGATALTIAGQLATDGTMPNLTDPNSRDKPWLSIKRPGGTVNLFGPLYPYVKAYASISQNAIEGKPRAAADDAIFLGRTRLSLPFGSLVDLIMGEDVMGNELEGPADFAKAQALRFAPISAREIGQGGIEGLREFPEGMLQSGGLRATRATEYRQAKNAADRFLADAGGDFAAAREAAIRADDMEAADNLTYQWRQDFEQGAKPLGLTVIKGSDDPPRAPRIELQSWLDRWKAEDWGAAFAEEMGIPARDNIAEQRAAFIAAHLRDYMLEHGVSEKTARNDLSNEFDKWDVVQSYERARKNAYLDFWRQHPELLYDAWRIGLEKLNDQEREILSEAADAGAFTP